MNHPSSTNNWQRCVRDCCRSSTKRIRNIDGRRSSPEDAAEATRSEELVIKGHRTYPRLVWPPSPETTAPRATAGATRVSRGHHCRCRSLLCNRRRCSSASGAPSQLACLPCECRYRSIIGECRRQSPTSGRHCRWPLGSPPLARPREPLLPIKPNPLRHEDVFIAPEPGVAKPDDTIRPKLPLVIESPGFIMYS